MGIIHDNLRRILGNSIAGRNSGSSQFLVVAVSVFGVNQRTVLMVYPLDTAVSGCDVERTSGSDSDFSDICSNLFAFCDHCANHVTGFRGGGALAA